jgi:hypothetical protein
MGIGIFAPHPGEVLLHRISRASRLPPGFFAGLAGPSFIWVLERLGRA